MDKKLLQFSIVLFFLSSCIKKHTPEEVASAYCKCVELSPEKKNSCIKAWELDFKSTLETKEEQQQAIYDMNECNGFAGENDFNLISI